ncbi:unnamed protein product [Allacma fusca]|uniref:Uncharacterized protein n=1 Tax=Allacma fusca TaxID=39272 RepID=A0A8J2PKY7_9HEXA|nr:unnamed protein product [Allacma fusca]
MDILDPVCPSPKNPRKRIAKPENWAQNLKKAKLRTGAGKNPVIKCNHREDSKSICEIHKFTENDIRKVFSSFYCDGNIHRQDSFILKHVTSSIPKRRQPRKDSPKSRTWNFKYSLPYEDDSTIKVCPESFRSILGIGTTRIHQLLRHWNTQNELKVRQQGEKRLNQNKELLKTTIRKHIERFQCRRSHYGRSDNLYRKYIPSNLTEAKMYRMFSDETHITGKYRTYNNIFKTEYNLSFGPPATDVCADCSRMTIEISAEQDELQKTKIEEQLKLHKETANKIYSYMNDVATDDASEVTIVFDLMQNQELPKTPVGEAYYARQLSQYFFGVVVHHGLRSKQTTEDVYFYTWGENQAGRGTNTITSASFDFLCHHLPQGIRHLRLFSDSCAGQNKNYAMLSMLGSFAKEKKIKISYVFPVKGHSFLPADRAFGRAEKLLKGDVTILTLWTMEYFKAYSQVATIKQLGVDWVLWDFKSFQGRVRKSKHSFLVREARMLRVTGDSLGFKSDFAEEFSEHSLLKRGFKWLPRKLQKIQIVSQVKDKKKQDVWKLLKTIGEMVTPSIKFSEYGYNCKCHPGF